MNQLTERQQTYNNISSTLACMSNKQLEQLLADGKAMHKGIGGTSLQIEIDNTPIFVKKVPITDLELKAENYMSTANIFNLPMCYQYGIGSTGYDYASSTVNLMHTVLTSYLGKDNWDMILSKFIDPKFDINIPISVKKLLSKYHGVALKMHEFYKAIQSDKSTPFPSSELNALLKKSKQVQS